MTIKSNAELNKAEPHLRDLEISVSGLNVVDIQFAGPGVWVPKFTIQLSGDQGLDRTTGQRRVYLSAAEYLRTALLNNGDGTSAHAFVPHANISREDLDGDIAEAVRVANNAIEGLLQAYREPVYNGDNPAPLEAFSWFGKSLYITARTVDFDLTEKRILSDEAFDKLQEVIDAPVTERNDALSELMLRDRKYVVRGEASDINAELLKGPRPDGFFEELAVSNVTKFFDGVQHSALTVESGLTIPNQVFWVPSDRINEFQSLDALNAGDVLTCVVNKDGWVEYLVQLGASTTLEVTPLDVRNTTKLFDGIQHKALVVPVAADAIDMVTIWVREDFTGEIDSLDDVRDDARLTCESPAGAEPTEWRLL